MSAAHYLDSSVLASAYLPDETGYRNAAALLDSSERLMVSELALTEVSSAIAAARRSGRLSAAQARRKLQELELGFGPNGWVVVVPLEGTATLARARELVIAHPVATLDAIHLAVAEREGRALAGDDLVFMTHDGRQREIAAKLGLAVG